MARQKFSKLCGIAKVFQLNFSKFITHPKCHLLYRDEESFIILDIRILNFLQNNRNLRSESCPFCRGSIKRVQSGDLWVLTCGTDVVDRTTVMKEDILRLYLYINSLPKDVPDALFLMYYEYLI